MNIALRFVEVTSSFDGARVGPAYRGFGIRVKEAATTSVHGQRAHGSRPHDPVAVRHFPADTVTKLRLKSAEERQAGGK